MIDINGIAHIQLSVRDFGASRAFYHALLHQTFGMAIQYDEPGVFYCIGGRTGLMITPVSPEFADVPFHQRRAGLHHVCFRLRSREDIDRLHERLIELGAPIIRAPVESSWAKGYYSVLCEDPDGIRIEANFVPGRGNLERLDEGPLDRPEKPEERF